MRRGRAARKSACHRCQPAIPVHWLEPDSASCGHYRRAGDQRQVLGNIFEYSINHLYNNLRAPVAQWIEQRTSNPQVARSSRAQLIIVLRTWGYVESAD